MDKELERKLTKLCEQFADNSGWRHYVFMSGARGPFTQGDLLSEAWLFLNRNPRKFADKPLSYKTTSVKNYFISCLRTAKRNNYQEISVEPVSHYLARRHLPLERDFRLDNEVLSIHENIDYRSPYAIKGIFLQSDKNLRAQGYVVKYAKNPWGRIVYDRRHPGKMACYAYKTWLRCDPAQKSPEPTISDLKRDYAYLQRGIRPPWRDGARGTSELLFDPKYINIGIFFVPDRKVAVFDGTDKITYITEKNAKRRGLLWYRDSIKWREHLNRKRKKNYF